MSRVVWTLGLLAPLVFAAIPSRWLDEAPSICVWRWALGRPCPGCGMTRALSHLSHGDVRGAWAYNPRVAIVAPLLAGVWARWLINRW